MKLRDYQFDAVRAVLYALATRPEANPCAVLPTGAGKSVVLAEVARTAVQEWHGRVVVLAHVKELLEQNAAKIRALCPGVPVGIHSAGLGARDTAEPIVVAGVQSAVRRADEFGPVNLAIVDEAHMIPPEGEGQYRTLLAALREKNPRLRVAGFTATPFRLDGGLICGEGKILTEVCYEIGVKALVEGGWLSPLTSRTHDSGAKLDGLHLRGGEFVQEEAAAAMGEKGVVADMCCDIARKTADRRSVLVFCASVEHAHAVAEKLAQTGETAVLTGETPAEERAEIIRRFRGEVQLDLFGGPAEKPVKYLCNVGVLTTGFDAPNCDCVVLARATNSTGLYVQMVGRGFRKAEGKADCLVLDYGGNLLRHGPVDALDIRKGTGARNAWRRCPACEAAVEWGAEACPECGEKMPLPPARAGGPRDPAGRVGDTASGAGILTSEDDPGFEDKGIAVREEFWEVHRKKQRADEPPKPPTVQITYFCGPNASYREWLCPEHAGFAREKFVKWWWEHADPTAPLPNDCQQAVDLFEAGATREVLEIDVARKPGDKWIRVTAWKMEPKCRRAMRAADAPTPEPTADRGDAWEPPAPAATAAPTNPEWDDPMDDLPF
jgi:DNA repair protein RadD